MSIIHNALKKAQSELKKNEAKSPSDPPPEKKDEFKAPPNIYDKLHNSKVKLETQQKSNNKENKKAPEKNSSGKAVMIIIVLLLLVAGILSFLYFDQIKETEFVSKQIEKIKIQDKAKPVVKQRVYSDDEIIFSGAIMGEQQAALINGDIYELGTSFKGKKIVRITLTEVDLLENGEVTTISIK